MAKYVTTKCSKCGYTIDFLRPGSTIPELDIPYHICPRCNQLLIKKNQRELIQRPNFKNEYLTKNRIGNFVISLVISYAIYVFSDEATIVIPFSIFFGVMAYVLSMKQAKESCDQLISDSLNRLKNKEYINTLLSLKLLKKDDVIKFKENYNTEFSEIETQELRLFISDVDACGSENLLKNTVESNIDNQLPKSIEETANTKESNEEIYSDIKTKINNKINNDTDEIYNSDDSQNSTKPNQVTKYCRKCGVLLDSESIFCRKCGNKVR